MRAAFPLLTAALLCLAACGPGSSDTTDTSPTTTTDAVAAPSAAEMTGPVTTPTPDVGTVVSGAADGTGAVNPDPVGAATANSAPAPQ